jgi:hypothetical protein
MNLCFESRDRGIISLNGILRLSLGYKHFKNLNSQLFSGQYKGRLIAEFIIVIFKKGKTVLEYKTLSSLLPKFYHTDIL